MIRSIAGDRPKTWDSALFITLFSLRGISIRSRISNCSGSNLFWNSINKPCILSYLERQRKLERAKKRVENKSMREGLRDL